MVHNKTEGSLGPVSQEKIDKLTKKVAKSLLLDEEVALSLIYNEWETVEKLFEKHKKVKTVHKHLLSEIDGSYRGFTCRNTD